MQWHCAARGHCCWLWPTILVLRRWRCEVQLTQTRSPRPAPGAAAGGKVCPLSGSWRSRRPSAGVSQRGYHDHYRPPSSSSMVRLQSAAVAFAPVQRAAYLSRPHETSAFICSLGMALTTAWVRPAVGATPGLPITGGCVLLRHTSAHSHGREARGCYSAWSTLPFAASGWSGRRAVWSRGTMPDAKWGAGSRSAVGCRVVLRDQLLSGGVEV